MNVRSALILGALVGFVIGRYKIYRKDEVKFHSASDDSNHPSGCQCAECYMRFGS